MNEVTLDDSAPPETAGGAHTFLDDPFADWGNDDLNFKPPVPLSAYKDTLRDIFLWPELRALFDAHQAAAAQARQRSRRWGTFAVWLGFVGLCTASFSPLILQLVANSAIGHRLDPVLAQHPYDTALGVVILVASLASGAFGYGAVLYGREKGRWLLNRFWCERLRQLHFQFVVNHLGLATEALHDPAAMTRYVALRNEYLALFREDYAATARDRLDALEKDVAENDVWIFPDWAASAAPLRASPGTEALLKVYAHQRFGIQKRFCEKKLTPSWYSPLTRAEVVTNSSNALTVVLLVLSILTAVSYLLKPDNLVALYTTSGFAGAFGACIAAMRVLNEGLQLTADTERYRWYLATVEAHERDFDKSPLKTRVDVLRDMELAAYQEMRRFLIAVSRSKFVM